MGRTEMPLQKRWERLERETMGKVPDRYGVAEFGDAGEVVSIKTGPLRDLLKDELGYGSASQVRWEVTQTRARAEQLAAEHRERLGH